MELSEFILLDKNKVRRDSNLMSLYIFFFKETFNYAPNCASCSFSNDWNKLISFHSVNKKKSITLIKNKIMSPITIKKIQGKILSYRKDGKTFRMYDHILTNDFINQFLQNGTDEEILERKKLFNFPAEKIQKPDLKFSNTQEVEKKRKRKNG
jgi:hypothetical protein